MSTDVSALPARPASSLSVLSRSLSGFERFLDADAAAMHVTDKPLFGVFRLLAQRLGRSNPIDPAGPADENVAAAIERLANANELLVRGIAVSGAWSCAGEGPLIALRQPQGQPARPVALLRKGKGWSIFDPASMEKPRPLDAALEAELLPKAWRLCRAFPMKPMRKRDLLLFANEEIRHNLVEFLVMSLLTGFATSLLA